MERPEPSLEELNAYVDNELTPERAADVAEAVARDPDVAHTVAALMRLRSVVANSIDVPPLAVPAGRRRSGVSIALRAACAAIIILAAGLTASTVMQEPEGSGWQAAVWRLHDGWRLPELSAEAMSQPVSMVEKRPASLAAAYLPDLSSAGLSVVWADSQARFSGAPAVLIGFAGMRGCKLSLIVTGASARLGTDLHRISNGAKSAYHWQAGGLAYLLVAEGMASQRLKLIAQSVHRASLEEHRLDTEVRTALSRNRRESPPCLA